METPVKKHVKVCKKCGVKPEWGAAYLICPKCAGESDYNVPNGNAVRTWNKANAEKEK